MTHRRSSRFTCGSCTVTHESYSELLLFAEQQLGASVFNKASYQMAGRTQWSGNAKRKKQTQEALPSFIPETHDTVAAYPLIKSSRDELMNDGDPAHSDFSSSSRILTSSRGSDAAATQQPYSIRRVRSSLLFLAGASGMFEVWRRPICHPACKHNPQLSLAAVLRFYCCCVRRENKPERRGHGA